MILVDTSVWIDFLRQGDTGLQKLWTRDKRLLVVAVRLGVSASTLH